MLNPFKPDTTTVYWTPYVGTPLNSKDVATLPETQILYQPPQPLLKEIANIHKGKEFLTCPAVIEMCQNVFVITAPMDVIAVLNPDTHTAEVRGFGWTQEFFDRTCVIRSDNTISMPPQYVFYAKDHVTIEVLPVFLLPSASIENIILIPGTMNISKWIRPVDFSFVVKDTSKPITIRKGEPLMLVRFIPKNNQKIVLEHVESTKELSVVVNACTMLKHRIANLKLPELYEMAKSHIDRFLGRKKKKCPFHWGK
jgi:hypothetical protein